MSHKLFHVFVSLSLAIAISFTAFISVQAGTPPNRLDFNGGRVLANPAIHNLYLDLSWDSHNPAAISRGNIDGFTGSLVSSNYFDKASQYGVGTATFTGSDEASILCPPPIVAGVTDFFAISAWMECMTAPGPDPIIRPVLTGIPAPDDNTVYAVYVPTGTQINDVAISSCGSFGAYHFFGTIPVWHIIFTPLPVPILLPQEFAYTVVPADCVNPGGPPTLDGISNAGSHELIEAATDPIILSGWIDNSKAIFNGDILKEGEAADICEGGGDVPTNPVRLTNGLLVSPYWSNADNACVPITHTITLGETGLPPGVPHEATFDGNNVTLPFTVIVDDSTTHSFSFPALVNDPNPGTRYVTAQPAETLNVTSNINRTASYTTQYFLTVSAAPPAAAALDVSLTPSDWQNAGTTVNLTTDAVISLSADNRFRFDQWSGDASGTLPSTSIVMDGPKSVTANYVTQHLVTVSTSGLGANNTQIFNGLTLLGTANDLSPLIVFVDDGPFALNTDAIVSGATGVQYVLQSFTPAPPAILNAAFTTTATYTTQYFLTVLTDPPSAAALDASLTPSGWQDAGVTVNLTTDDILNLSPDSRLRFDHWSGDASGTSTSTTVLMDGPKSVTANYVSQHLLTVNTSGLGNNDTHIFNGATLLGTANDTNPLVLFLDDGPFALSVDAYINGTSGVQYFFQDFTPAPPTTLNAAFTTVATYKTVSQLIDEALASGAIHGPGARGLANSYRRQFARVEQDIASGDYDKALLHLKTFINHVRAQSGKKLTSAFARTLELDALLVYHNMLCRAIDAGQISATTASRDYAYYSNLVSSLGGTVLPPC